MRLIFTFLLILGLSPLIHAHIGGHHHHKDLKQWSFSKHDKKLAASFLSYKDEMVTLEDAHGNRSRFSIEDFSCEDQKLSLIHI